MATTRNNTTVLDIPCPYSEKFECPHWLGWIDDGRKVIWRDRNRRSSDADDEVKDTDTVLPTGAVTRIYRRLAKEAGGKQ
jgi:hypothetical protein